MSFTREISVPDVWLPHSPSYIIVSVLLLPPHYVFPGDLLPPSYDEFFITVSPFVA